MGTKKYWVVSVGLALGAIFVGSVDAAPRPSALQQSVRFESATLGPTGQDHGFTISKKQWLGFRFTTTTPLRVKAIGGHISQVTPGNLFVAIFPTSEQAIPESPPNPAQALFIRTFDAPSVSREIRVPANFSLSPGTYAIVFGSGAAGAEAHGVIPGTDNEVGSPDYLSWADNRWVEGGFGGARFFIDSDRILPDQIARPRR
jgi:hypothetical protein